MEISKKKPKNCLGCRALHAIFKVHPYWKTELDGKEES